MTGIVSIDHYVLVASIVFTIGAFGIFVNRRNIILIFMCIELMLLSVNILLIAFSALHQDILGNIYSLLVLCVAAAEASIGLAILVCFYRNRGTISVESATTLRG